MYYKLYFINIKKSIKFLTAKMNLNYVILFILILILPSLTQELYMSEEECNDPICILKCNSKNDIMIDLQWNFDIDDVILNKYYGVIYSKGKQKNSLVSFVCLPNEKIIETSKMECPKINKEVSIFVILFYYLISLILIAIIVFYCLCAFMIRIAKLFDKRSFILWIFKGIFMIIFMLLLPYILFLIHICRDFIPDVEEEQNEEMAPSPERNYLTVM